MRVRTYGFPGVLRGLRDLGSRPPRRIQPRRSLSSPWVNHIQSSGPAMPKTLTRRPRSRASDRGAASSRASRRPAASACSRGRRPRRSRAARPSNPYASAARAASVATPPPRVSRQAPADLRRRQHVGQERRRRQPAEAEEPARPALALHRPEPEPALAPFRLEAVDQVIAQPAPEHAPGPDPAHDLRIGVDDRERRAVLGPPAAQEQTLGRGLRPPRPDRLAHTGVPPPPSPPTLDRDRAFGAMIFGASRSGSARCRTGASSRATRRRTPVPLPPALIGPVWISRTGSGALASITAARRGPRLVAGVGEHDDLAAADGLDTLVAQRPEMAVQARREVLGREVAELGLASLPCWPAP